MTGRSSKDSVVPQLKIANTYIVIKLLAQHVSCGVACVYMTDKTLDTFI